MARQNLQPGIRFSPRGIFDKRFQAVAGTTLRVVEEDMLDKLFAKSKTVMQRAIRSRIQRERTGLLVASVGIFAGFKSGGSFDRRRSFEVQVNAPYADFVDRGVGPSPGAFFPIPGQGTAGEGYRIKNGMHPGQEAKNFSGLAQTNLQKIVDKEFGNLFIRNFTRQLKARTRGGFN